MASTHLNILHVSLYHIQAILIDQFCDQLDTLYNREDKVYEVIIYNLLTLINYKDKQQSEVKILNYLQRTGNIPQ